jgi:hypothetical protein
MVEDLLRDKEFEFQLIGLQIYFWDLGLVLGIQSKEEGFVISQRTKGRKAL